MNRAAAAGLATLATIVVSGCEPRPPEHAPEVESARPGEPRSIVDELPEALLVRFETVSGSALEREGWELEVLQMGPEVRVRGAIRTRGVSAPIYRVMSDTEYRDFWAWLSSFPLDRHRVEQDVAAPQTGWRKSCKIDIVLGPDERILAENRWTRPLLSPAWMHDLEARLHLMALDYAEAAIGEPPIPPEDAAAIEKGMQRALKALGEE